MSPDPIPEFPRKVHGVTVSAFAFTRTSRKPFLVRLDSAPYISRSPNLGSQWPPVVHECHRASASSNVHFLEGPENVRVSQHNAKTSGYVVSSYAIDILPQLLRSQGHFCA